MPMSCSWHANAHSYAHMSCTLTCNAMPKCHATSCPCHVHGMRMPTHMPTCHAHSHACTYFLLMQLLSTRRHAHIMHTSCTHHARIMHIPCTCLLLCHHNVCVRIVFRGDATPLLWLPSIFTHVQHLLPALWLPSIYSGSPRPPKFRPSIFVFRSIDPQGSTVRASLQLVHALHLLLQTSLGRCRVRGPSRHKQPSRYKCHHHCIPVHLGKFPRNQHLPPVVCQ